MGELVLAAKMTHLPTLLRYGQVVSAGPFILSGSFIRPIDCPSGTKIHTDIGTPGSVDIHFA